jgi:hypothetical protein
MAGSFGELGKILKGRKTRKPRNLDQAITHVAKRKSRKEARKVVKKAGGMPAGGLFDWLFGK